MRRLGARWYSRLPGRLCFLGSQEPVRHLCRGRWADVLSLHPHNHRPGHLRGPAWCETTETLPRTSPATSQRSPLKSPPSRGKPMPTSQQTRSTALCGSGSRAPTQQSRRLWWRRVGCALTRSDRNAMEHFTAPATSPYRASPVPSVRLEPLWGGQHELPGAASGKDVPIGGRLA